MGARGPKAKPVKQRVLELVVRDPDTDCWEWLGSRDRNGYGLIVLTLAPREYVNTGAHRASYLALVGSIPDGLVIDHRCRNHGCVNPAHLEPVTNRENILRGTGFAARNAAKITCAAGHPFDSTHGAVDSLGRRWCRTCKRERDRARWAVRSAA